MIDFSGMLSAVANTFCDTAAVWVSAATSASVDLLIASDIELNEEQKKYYKISSSEQKVVGCPGAHIDGMKNKDTLIIDGGEYSVMRFRVESDGWAIIIVERMK